MRICSAALALAAVLAATSAHAIPTRTALADFAIGVAATGEGDLNEAARRFDAALAADPGNPTLRRAAFASALQTGDRRRVDALAPTLPVGEGSDSVVLLLRLVHGFDRRDWADVSATADAIERLKLYDPALPLVSRAWARFGRGDVNGALALLNTTTAPPGALATVGEQRARMLAAAGRWTDARGAFAGLLLTGQDGGDIRLLAADAAARTGDKAAVRDLLVETEPSGVFEAARRRFAAGKPILPGGDAAREAMASMIGSIASGDLARRQPLGAVPFARIATFMAPAADLPRLRLAGLLGQAHQPVAALGVLGQIGPKSVWASEALAARARIEIAAGPHAPVIAALRRAADAKDAGAYAWTLLAEAQLADKQYAAAAESYGRALALAQANGTVGWALWFQRGSAYEQGKDWPRAEPDLRRALALAPRQPIVLNYLGYSLIDRGLKLDEGTRLIGQALAVAPNSPAILDSLGWAYYRTARYGEAVSYLQRAAAGDPSDPSVSEHLGDAYWRVGRRIEARFRWNAAATMDPEPDQKARLAAKIDYGLDQASLAGGATGA